MFCIINFSLSKGRRGVEVPEPSIVGSSNNRQRRVTGKAEQDNLCKIFLKICPNVSFQLAGNNFSNFLILTRLKEV